MLTQEVLALVAVDLVFDLALHPALRLGEFDLGVDEDQHPADPRFDRFGLQHGLFVLEPEV